MLIENIKRDRLLVFHEVTKSSHSTYNDNSYIEKSTSKKIHSISPRRIIKSSQPKLVNCIAPDLMEKLIKSKRNPTKHPVPSKMKMKLESLSYNPSTNLNPLDPSILIQKHPSKKILNSNRSNTNLEEL